MDSIFGIDFIWYAMLWVVSLVIAIKLRHGAGMMWAILLGPLGVLMAIVLHVPPDTKKCPDCAELVKEEARVCKYCSHKFEQKEEEKTCPSCHEKVIPVDGQCPNCEAHL